MNIPTYKLNTGKRYIESHINIDGNNIKSTESFNRINTIYTNKIKFTKNSNIVEITSTSDHKLSLDDDIRFDNIEKELKTIKLLNGLQFTQDSNFVKVNHKNHGLDDSYLNTPLYVTIKGVIGNDINNKLLNNINPDLINRDHLIYYRLNPDDKVNPDYYYIRIDIKSNKTFTYQNIVQVTINNILNYDINIFKETFKVFQIKDSLNFNIKLNNISLNDLEINNRQSINTLKIENINSEEDINNGQFTIKLNKTYSKIRDIKVISSEITLPEKNVPETSIKIKINNVKDTITINIPEGKYSIKSLLNFIQEQFYKMYGRNNKYKLEYQYNEMSQELSISLYRKFIGSKMTFSDNKININLIDVNAFAEIVDKNNLGNTVEVLIESSDKYLNLDDVNGSYTGNLINTSDEIVPFIKIDYPTPENDIIDNYFNFFLKVKSEIDFSLLEEKLGYNNNLDYDISQFKFDHINNKIISLEPNPFLLLYINEISVDNPVAKIIKSNDDKNIFINLIKYDDFYNTRLDKITSRLTNYDNVKYSYTLMIKEEISDKVL